MAIALGQSPNAVSSATAGTTIASAYGSAVAAGTFLFGMVQWASPADTETCTVSDSVNGSWTAIGSPQHDTTNHISTQNFYFLSSGAGTPTVTGTISTSVSFRIIKVVSLTGVASIEGTPTYSTGAATSATAPAVTPAVSTDAILATCAPADSVTAASAPMTMFSGTLSGLGIANDLNAGTSAVTPTFTKNGTGKYFASAVVLVASGGGGGSASQTLSTLGVG
jgi:hypothetical protein